MSYPIRDQSVNPGAFAGSLSAYHHHTRPIEPVETVAERQAIEPAFNNVRLKVRSPAVQDPRFNRALRYVTQFGAVGDVLDTADFSVQIPYGKAGLAGPGA